MFKARSKSHARNLGPLGQSLGQTQRASGLGTSSWSPKKKLSQETGLCMGRTIYMRAHLSQKKGAAKFHQPSLSLVEGLDSSAPVGEGVLGHTTVENGTGPNC